MVFATLQFFSHVLKTALFFWGRALLTAWVWCGPDLDRQPAPERLPALWPQSLRHSSLELADLERRYCG